jgi:hypothetical protein
MDTCHIITTGPLIFAGIAFLVGVLWLDGYRVRFSREFASTGSADALKRHLWLNVFVALGALAAAAALVLTSACSAHSF